MKKAAALKYPEGVNAPIILAKGEGKVAEQILNEAEKNSIPMEENLDLVNLLEKQNVGNQVPEEAWESLAIIFSYILKENQ